MANARSRSFDQRGGITGTYQTFPPFPGITVQSALAGSYGTCDDSVAGRTEKRTPHALLIVKKTTKLPIFNGRFPKTGSPIKQLTNCPADYHPSEPSPGAKFPALSTVQESSLAWESLARTNPNVAHVSLPTYWAELKDLPQLWRSWGDKQLRTANDLWESFSSKLRIKDRDLFLTQMSRYAPHYYYAAAELAVEHAARFNIWWRWGWAPLVADIRKMFTFTEGVQRRLQWLTDLQNGKKVLKRRAAIRSSTIVDPPTSVGLKSVGATITGRRTVTYSERIWCSVQWRLAPGVDLARGHINGLGVGLRGSFEDGDPLWQKAYQLTWGLTNQDALDALWQIMPWSWFADWFLHLSTVMDATKNTIPVTHGDICLMRHTNATATVEPLTSSPDLAWCTVSGQHLQSEDRKQRLIVSPVLPFAPSMMPVFTTGQWSILGSLAVLGSKGPYQSRVR
jgi:hypothetical protein